MEDRNLDLVSRGEGTREKNRLIVVKFKLTEIMQHFNENVNAIKAQFAVADELSLASKVQESENIWRAQIVFLESAFDFYLHELTKYGLSEIFSDNWDHTQKYDNIEIQMKIVESALKAGEESDWFLNFINGFYEKITMVSYETVKDQINLLGLDIDTISERAFYERGSTEKPKMKLKRRLNELFNRRNIIAHQSDRGHVDAQKKDISKDIVHEFIQDIEKIVASINEEAENK